MNSKLTGEGDNDDDEVVKHSMSVAHGPLFPYICYYKHDITC